MLCVQSALLVAGVRTAPESVTVSTEDRVTPTQEPAPVLLAGWEPSVIQSVLRAPSAWPVLTSALATTQERLGQHSLQPDMILSLFQCDHISGACQCGAGWQGALCEEPCPPGSHGYNCTKSCQCQHGGKCHPVTGSCSCTPGWEVSSGEDQHSAFCL